MGGGMAWKEAAKAGMALAPTLLTDTYSDDRTMPERSRWVASAMTDLAATFLTVQFGTKWRTARSHVWRRCDVSDSTGLAAMQYVSGLAVVLANQGDSLLTAPSK